MSFGFSAWAIHAVVGLFVDNFSFFCGYDVTAVLACWVALALLHMFQQHKMKSMIYQASFNYLGNMPNNLFELFVRRHGNVQFKLPSSDGGERKTERQESVS